MVWFFFLLLFGFCLLLDTWDTSTSFTVIKLARNKTFINKILLHDEFTADTSYFEAIDGWMEGRLGKFVSYRGLWNAFDAFHDKCSPQHYIIMCYLCCVWRICKNSWVWNRNSIPKTIVIKIQLSSLSLSLSFFFEFYTSIAIQFNWVSLWSYKIFITLKLPLNSNHIDWFETELKIKSIDENK